VLLETTVAIVILAAAFVAVAHTMAAMAAQRRTAERRTLAQQEVANLMERIYILPADEITEKKMAELELSTPCRERLPEAELEAPVDLVDGNPPAKRISIQIEWTGHGGARSQPVRLTAWKYAKKGAAE